MSNFKKNMSILKKHSKVLYKLIQEEATLFPLELEPFKDGLGYKIKRNNLLVNMHSVYDMEFEMEKIFQKLTGSEDTLVLFGLGNGYALKYIKKNFLTVEKVIVIEPSLDIIKLFLENSNLIEYTKGLSVSFLINKSFEFVGKEVGDYFRDENIKIIHHLSYRIIFEEYYSNMLKFAKDVVLIRKSNYQFQSVMRRHLMVNFLSNIDFNNNNSSKLESLIKNKPLLIVAAGPSLNINMHLLKKIKKNVVIVAVGSAIKILDANGIIPHFRMAFDPTELEMKVIKNIDTSVSPIIYSTALFYDILPNYKGAKILPYISSDNGKRYLLKKNNLEESRLTTATSILISGVDMGAIYGATKVIFIGVDLSISDEKVYADGFEEDQLEMDRKNIVGNGVVETVDINGKKIYTTSIFDTHKIGLEQVIKNNSQIRFIDATEGGVKIKGAEICKLKDVIKKELVMEYDELENINKIFKEEELDKEELDKEEFDKEEFDSKLKNIVKSILEELEEVNDINNNRIEELKKIKKYNDKKINNLYNEKVLKSIKKYEKDLNNNILYNSYINPSMKSVFNGIHNINRYNGFDKNKNISSQINKWLGISVELLAFIDSLRDFTLLKINGDFDRTIRKLWKY